MTKTERIRRHLGLAALLLFLCAGMLLSACSKDHPDTDGTGTSSDASDLSPEAVGLRDLTVGIGAVLPRASDFFAALPEGCSAELLTSYSTLTTVGVHEIKLSLTDASGQTRELTVTLTLVRDEAPPVLSGVTDLSVQIGEAVAYRKNVRVSDDCFGELKLDVDSSLVDLSKEGSYPVTYTATDAAGNRTSLTAYVHVYAHMFSESDLWELVDGLIQTYHLDSDMTTEQRCRVIYQYAQSHIAYSGGSDKSDWKREAYTAISKGTGDCFSYFAVSKAFFERLGIENLDVERSADVAAAVNERHYWSMINIAAEGQAAVWYHFDACRLNASYPHSGCLLTDKQIDAYNRLRRNAAGVNNYFYAYDKEKYPATSNVIITETPALEPYD